MALAIWQTMSPADAEKSSWSHFDTDILDILAGTGNASVDRPNDCVDERFSLLEKLGEGAFGIVWKARQMNPARVVAIKILKVGADPALSLHLRERFDGEHQALARLEGRGTPAFFEAGYMLDGRAYFVMSYIEGLPITSWVEQNGCNLNERIRLMLLVCQTIEHAHLKGLWHRDLKPANILVQGDGAQPQPIVVDFGIAKSRETLELRTATANGAHWQTAGVTGTPGYRSPEQALGSPDRVDARSDVYSLGAVLHELAFGRLPEPQGQALQPKDLCERKGHGKQTARQHRELCYILARALEPNPDLRYQRPTDLGADLLACLEDTLVKAHPQTVTYRLGKEARRHWRAVMVGLIIIALTSLYLIHIQAEQLATERALDLAERRLRQLEAAQLESTQLVDFMARDLYNKLEEVGRLDLMADVNTRVLDYYDAPQHAPTEPQAALNHAEMLLRFGHVLTDQGKYQESFAIAMRMLEILQPLMASNDTELTLSARELTAEARWLQGSSFNGQQLPSAALAALAKAREALESINSQKLSDEGLMLRANIEDQRAAALHLQLDFEAALTTTWQAEKLYLQAHEHGLLSGRLSAATIKGNIAILLQKLSRYTQAVAVARTGVDALAELSRQYPERSDFAKQLIIARTRLAEAYVLVAKKADAEEQIDAALAQGEPLLIRDPSNEDLCIVVSDILKAKAEAAEAAGLISVAADLRRRECEACAQPISVLGGTLRTLQPLWTRQKTRLSLLQALKHWDEAGICASTIAELSQLISEQCAQQHSRLISSTDDPGWQDSASTAQSLQNQCAQFRALACQLFLQAGDYGKALRETALLKDIGNSARLVVPDQATDWRQAGIIGLRLEASVLEKQRRIPEAVTAADQAITAITTHPAWQQRPAKACEDILALSIIILSSGHYSPNHPGVSRAARALITAAEAQLQQQPNDPAWLNSLEQAWLALADHLDATGHAQESSAASAQAAKLRQPQRE